MEWEIFYGDGSVYAGPFRADWSRAPEGGVQVIRRMRPDLVGVPTPDLPLTVRRWRGVRDRELWTGQDSYNPFGWGEKRGSLIDRATYDAIWERAAYG